MSTSRWNLLPLRMFRGLPAAAHEVTGSPVMGLTGTAHMSAAWALNTKLDVSSRPSRSGKKRRVKALGGYEGGFGCGLRVCCLNCYHFHINILPNTTKKNELKPLNQSICSKSTMQKEFPKKVKFRLLLPQA